MVADIGVNPTTSANRTRGFGEVVGDHRRVRLQPGGDLVGKDVVQQIVGLLLKPIPLPHEIRHAGIRKHGGAEQAAEEITDRWRLDEVERIDHLG